MHFWILEILAWSHVETFGWGPCELELARGWLGHGSKSGGARVHFWILENLAWSHVESFGWGPCELELARGSS